MKIAFDIKLMRPGCALIQAAMGCTHGVANQMTTHWLLMPTPDMAIYEVTGQQLELLAKKVHRQHGENIS